jgi:hypothetical protein
MKSKNRKWWLAVVALLCLAPAAFPVQDHNNVRKGRENFQPVTVPEGGSSLVYVLGAGVTCLGAMLLRSRVAKTKES